MSEISAGSESMDDVKVSYDLDAERLKWRRRDENDWRDVGTTRVETFDARFYWATELSDTPVTIMSPSTLEHVPLSEMKAVLVTLPPIGGTVELRAARKTYNGYVSTPGQGSETLWKPTHRAPPQQQPDPPPRLGRSGGEAPATADELRTSSSSSDPEPRPPRVGR